MKEKKERRKFLRLDTSVVISYAQSKLSPEERFSVSKNISRGGVCIATNDPLKESDLMDLKMTLSANEPSINVTARVIWCKEASEEDKAKGKSYEVGLEFVKISDDERYRLVEFIYQQLKIKV